MCSEDTHTHTHTYVCVMSFAYIPWWVLRVLLRVLVDCVHMHI